HRLAGRRHRGQRRSSCGHRQGEGRQVRALLEFLGSGRNVPRPCRSLRALPSGGNGAVSVRASAIVIALIVLLDQYTKSLVASSWRLGETLPVVPDVFSLTYVRNRGGAFGLMSDLPEAWRVAVFVLFALATVSALIWMLRNTPRGDVLQRFAITAVIGGAAGNLYDRIRYGEVVDFLDVYYRDWHWPAFNVADSFISCGVVLLLIGSLRQAREPS